MQICLALSLAFDVLVFSSHREVLPRVWCTLVDDTVAEVVFLPDPVGGLMVSTLARKFAIPLVEFYYFRQLDAEARQTAVAPDGPRAIGSFLPVRKRLVKRPK